MKFSIVWMIIHIALAAPATPPATILFRVVAGDKVTLITLDGPAGKRQAHMEQTYRKKIDVPLSDDSFQYVQEQVRALGSPRDSEPVDGCRRDYLTIQTQGTSALRLSGCFAHPSKLSKKMIDLTNLVGVLFQQ